MASEIKDILQNKKHLTINGPYQSDVYSLGLVLLQSSGLLDFDIIISLNE